MNINLSKSEIQVIIGALQPSPHAFAKDLIDKLQAALQPAEAKAEKMMKGTASPTVEPLCGNDPVNW